MSRRKRPRAIHVSFHRTEPDRCPKCQIVLRSATGLTNEAGIIPGPGVMSLCDSCATWITWNDDMTYRLATDAEIARLDPRMKQIATEIAIRLFLKRHPARH